MDNIELRPCDTCMIDSLQAKSECTHKHLEAHGSGQQAWYPWRNRIGAWRFFTDTTRPGHWRCAVLVVNGEAKVQVSMDYHENVSVETHGIEQFGISADVMNALHKEYYW